MAGLCNYAEYFERRISGIKSVANISAPSCQFVFETMGCCQSFFHRLNQSLTCWRWYCSTISCFIKSCFNRYVVRAAKQSYVVTKSSQIIITTTTTIITRSTQRAQTSLAEADHYSHIAHCKNVEPWLWKTTPPPPKKTRRPDLILIDKIIEGCKIIDVAVRKKRANTVPIVIGALGSISKNHLMYLGELECNISFKTIQKTALLGTAHILRRSLYWLASASSDF